MTWLHLFAAPILCAAASVTATVPLVPDHLAENGRFIGQMRDAGVEDCKALQQTTVTIRDLAESSFKPELQKNGFELINVPAGVRLPEPEDVQHIGMGVNGETTQALAPWVNQFSHSFFKVQLGSQRLCLLRCAGAAVRAAGPDGMGDSGTPATLNAHVDQDRLGEPLRSMVPFGWMYKWLPSLRLVSLWFPLNDVGSRPLAIFDAAQVKDTMLVRLRTETYNRTSDRFLVTINATEHWWFHSSMVRGQGYVMDSFRSPHTSFQHPAPEMAGMRRSMEIRCAAVLLPELAYGLAKLTVTLLTGVALFRALRRKP